MRFNINKIRMWLAQRVAPVGAEVLGADEARYRRYVDLMESVFYGYGWVRREGHKTWMDVTYLLDDAVGEDLVDKFSGGHTDWKLTDHGTAVLGELWGPGRVPPWSAGFVGDCDDHGEYDQHPGDLCGCPGCRTEKAITNLSSEALFLAARQRARKAFR